MKKSILSDRLEDAVKSLPAPFNADNPIMTKFGVNPVSKFAAMGRQRTPQRVSLYPAVIKALFMYVEMLSSNIGEDCAGPIGLLEDGSYYTECAISSSRKVCVKASKTPNTVTTTFNLLAVVIMSQDGTYNQYVFGTDESAGEGYGAEMIYCILPYLLKESEAASAFRTFQELAQKGQTDNLSPEDQEKLVLQGALLSSNIENRLLRSSIVDRNEKGSGCEVYAEYPEVEILANTEAEFAQINVTKNLSTQKFVYAKCSDTSTLRKNVSTMQELAKKWTFEEFAGAFQRDPDRVLTKEEMENVVFTKNKLGSTYVVAKQVVQAAIAAFRTYKSDLKYKMNNFYFYGPSGGGKTLGAMALAVALNIPYVEITFSANTEMMDILQAISPCTVDEEGHEHAIEELLEGMPSSEDIMFDPVHSYEMITGIKDEQATPIMCIAAKMQDLGNHMVESNQRFKYVDSPLAKAFRYGWLCELQEPNIVSNPGVLVGINNLLDMTASMVCADGTVIHRHPDFVVVDTTNRSYSGCREMNASHLSRFHMAFDFPLPTEEEMIERVIKNTNVNEPGVIKKMLQVVESISDTLRNHGERNFSVGTREVCSWLTWGYILGGDYAAAAQNTIIPLATQNDDLLDTISGCVNTVF